MGTIETEKDFDTGLTTNVAKGKFDYEEFLKWIANYYSGNVTELILWDLSEADLSKITSREFRKIVEKVKKQSHKRAGGKTAFVFTKDLGFGLGRMFGTLAEVEEVQFEYRTFRSISKAKEWLGV